MEYLEILKDTFLTDDRYMYIVSGVIFSIGITLFSAILGIILGLLLAIMKLSHWYPFKRIKALENFNPFSKDKLGTFGKKSGSQTTSNVNSKYKVGDVVNHKKFGRGKIKKVDTKSMVVEFMVGEKKIALVLADKILEK